MRTGLLFSFLALFLLWIRSLYKLILWILCQHCTRWTKDFRLSNVIFRSDVVVPVSLVDLTAPNNSFEHSYLLSVYRKLYDCIGLLDNDLWFPLSHSQPITRINNELDGTAQSIAWTNSEHAVMEQLFPRGLHLSYDSLIWKSASTFICLIK